jgi:GTP-binding protein EngB required for normal cell division
VTESTAENKQFDELFDKAYEDKASDFDGCVNIALVGKVSSGKSSLINALFERGRDDWIADVGSLSGVTTGIHAYPFEDKVLVIDCPGLSDVKKENSELTRNFLKSIDMGIFVVTGSADSSQRDNFLELKSSCKHAIVVLNKIDEWDDLEESALDKVVDQWKATLGVSTIYKTCTKGFDPNTRKSAPMDIRGVDEMRDSILEFLRAEKKDILLARFLKNKDKYAISIIAGALVAVAGEAFIPGSAAYITATQVIAITSLNYLYTGHILDKGSVIRMLPSFIGESIGSNLFLWAKSFLPPTLVLDVAAAGIAVVVTFAMLAAVRWVLEHGHSLEDRDELKKAFNIFKVVGAELKGIRMADLKNRAALLSVLGRLLKKAVLSAA